MSEPAETSCHPVDFGFALPSMQGSRFASHRSAYESTRSARLSEDGAGSLKCNSISSESTTDITCPSGVPKDLLTVFQAEPLAYIDENQISHSIDVLDFECERDILLRTFRESGANIYVAFETATTDRLGAFLARGEGRVLHFSCHGHPQYLAVDDGWGALQTLSVWQIKEWISRGGRSLHFVFVSACHSRSIGEAFVEAGVPHVVCCRQDSHMLRADAAIEFEKFFYRALACGKHLQEAFDLACQEILVCPTLSIHDRQEEVSKFCLLPQMHQKENYHDVPIFFTQPKRQRPSYVIDSPPATLAFPPPPDNFLGRNLDIFRILQALRVSRFVRVSGPPGIGKSALIKACCRFISKRLHIMKFDDIRWVPFERDDEEDELSVCFTNLFEGLQEKIPVWLFRENYTSCIKKIIRLLEEYRVLLIVEAKSIPNDGTLKLLSFLDTLFRKTRHVSLIVIHRTDQAEFSTHRMQCVESNIEVGYLDLEAAVNLFARMCPHVAERTYHCIGNPKDLCRLLLPASSKGGVSMRLARIFEMLGEGIPENIQRRAKEMSPTTYRKLIAIGRQRELDLQVESRAAIIKRMEELSKDIADSVLDRDFERAHELQAEYDEIEALQKDFPDLRALKRKEETISFDIDMATSAKD